MAVTSVGFTGTVTEADWSKISVFGSQYGVLGASDLKVSIVSGVDRTVRVAAGTAWAKGVLVTSDATTDVQLGVIASGERWDTIVIRRNRGTGSSSIIALAGTSTKGISASRHVDWASDHDDQPLALARVVAGQSNVVEVVDLRCWAGDGGVVAADAEALGYIVAPGSTVWVSGVEWVRDVASNGTVSWVRADGVSVQDVPLAGSWSGQRTKTLIRGRAWTTDGNGDVIVLPSGQYTGVLRARLDPAGTDPLTVVCRNYAGIGIVARVSQAGAVKANHTFAGVADVLYW